MMRSVSWLLKGKVFAALMKKVCLGGMSEEGWRSVWALSPAYKVGTKAVILYKCTHFQDMMWGRGPRDGSDCSISALLAPYKMIFSPHHKDTHSS